MKVNAAAVIAGATDPLATVKRRRSIAQVWQELSTNLPEKGDAAFWRGGRGVALAASAGDDGEGLRGMSTGFSGGGRGCLIGGGAARFGGGGGLMAAAMGGGWG